MDDPILWGILPLSYMFSPDNLRWGLASYDLCFTNKYAALLPDLWPHTDAVAGDYLPSSHSARLFPLTAAHTRNSAVSSNRP